MKISPAFGGSTKGERLKQLIKSPHFTNGIFQNPIPTQVQSEDASMLKVLGEFIRKGEQRIPGSPLPIVPISKSSFSKTHQDIRVNWLGHSSSIIEIDGKIIFTDPVFSKYTSPFSFGGAKHFEYSHYWSLEELPQPDVVIISHDHYDHLDYHLMLELKKTDAHFVMPLGVGAHFRRWGFHEKQYTELDWHQCFSLDKQLQITATPARHFSGRGLTDRFKTLWASWVITTPRHSVFFSGDTGYFPGFKNIGDQYGPFDICLMECGQYNQNWAQIHMSPEESVQAFIDLKGKLMLPIHWGKFKLSLHTWTEPVERALKAAKQQQVKLTTPSIGEQIIAGKHTPQKCWWHTVE